VIKKIFKKDKMFFIYKGIAFVIMTLHISNWKCAMYELKIRKP
jgi:hypothetical protein